MSEREIVDAEDLNDDPDLNRFMAAAVVSMLRESITVVTEQAVSSKRWVLTSLLAINGAAAVATWQVKMAPEPKIGACIVFVVGILLSLLSAEIGANGAPQLVDRLREQMGYWMAVAHDGERLGSMEAEHDIDPLVKKLKRVPIALGWASTACFVIGVGVAGYAATPAILAR